MSRDTFLFWWPVVARLAGMIGGFSEAGYALIHHQGADVGFLGFCGALIVAPAIFTVDDKKPPDPPAVQTAAPEEEKHDQQRIRPDS
jgi:hypothetical protein